MASISLKLDSVQKYLATAITNELGTLLETPIEIGSLKVTNFDEVQLKKITLGDFSGDTIIFAENATAHISPYSLLKHRIQINTMQTM